ncbi:MAG TPA: VCBS repeat-containing protein [Planctomycetota bacterium]|nr:VCBS repeat-containing protein [Planctomycetota bacterium]
MLLPRPLGRGARLLAALLLLVTGRVPAQQFFSEIVLDTADVASAIAAGDLNGDGHPELVVAARNAVGPSPAAVYINDGAGNFTVRVDVPMGPCVDLAIGDVTGDGRPDLVANRWFPALIVYAAGDGAGGFATPVTMSVPAASPPLGVMKIAVRDIAGDSRLEVLTINDSNGTDQNASLFYSDGAGGLLPPVEAMPNHDGVNGLVLESIDGDGDLDLVTQDAFVPGNGAGLFDSPSPAGLGALVDLAAGDFNGDFELDLVAVNDGNPGSVKLALGDGAGGFSASATFVAGNAPHAVAVGDIDGDGRLDVVTANQGSPGGVAILLGDGLGGLGSASTLPVTGTGVGPYDVVVTDVDLDGRLDIAVAVQGAGALSLFRQTDGSFATAAPVTVNSLKASSAIALADLDGDGDLDAVTTRASGAGTETTLQRWLGDGSGALGSPVASTVGAEQQDVALGDLDGDGRPDVVASLALLDKLAVLGNDGAGNLLPATLCPAGDKPAAVALGDVDLDGRLDAVTANELSHDVSVLLGDGAGAFAAPLHTFVSGLAPNAVALDDVDDDGALDAVTGNRESQDVSVLLGDGAGGFAAPSVLAAGWPVEAVAIGDLDGDGHEDLVAGGTSGSPANSGLSVFRGLGGGDFDLPLAAASVGPVTDLAVGDVNGDGRPDVIAAREGGSRVDVRLGVGDGTLLPAISLTAVLPSGVVLGDLDGDQRLDLASSMRTSSSSGAITIHLNLSTPHVWRDLGHALDGSFGPPSLTGIGPLTAGSPGTLTLDDAFPSQVGVLFVSPTSAPAPFKGGVLVPVPPLLSQLVRTGPDGRLLLQWASWTPGVPGSSWYFQYAIADPAGPVNVALSNALRALQP